MKYFVIVSVLLFACANAASTKSSSSSAEENIKELAVALKEKFNTTILLDMIHLAEKAKEKCPDIEDKIESTMDKVTDCLDDIELGSETMCTLIKTNFAKCSKPARELITSCFPEESKELPEMVENIILAIIDQVCKSTVEEILELFNPCVLEADPEKFEACKEIKTTLEQHKDKLPSKSLVCSTLPKIRNCVKASQDAACKNPITKQAALKFHDAMDKAVKDQCDAANKV